MTFIEIQSFQILRNIVSFINLTAKWLFFLNDKKAFDNSKSSNNRLFYFNCQMSTGLSTFRRNKKKYCTINLFSFWNKIEFSFRLSFVSDLKAVKRHLLDFYCQIEIKLFQMSLIYCQMSIFLLTCIYLTQQTA